MSYEKGLILEFTFGLELEDRMRGKGVLWWISGFSMVENRVRPAYVMLVIGHFKRKH
jgi:hypothetical protein